MKQKISRMIKKQKKDIYFQSKGKKLLMAQK